ncbi:MAG: hypothetical protein ABI321_12365 [Polyangia bacterium]
MTRTIPVLATLLMLGLTSGGAHATTMVPLDLKGLTDRAEAVVSGHVTATKSSWSAGHDAIYTDATLHVERVITGAITVGQDVIVRREGGSVDGVGMMVFGAPELVPGEEVVVFLEHRGAARYVVGMAQGKIDVATIDGKKQIRRNLSSVHFTRTPTVEEQALSHIDTVDQLAVAVRRFAQQSK